MKTGDRVTYSAVTLPQHLGDRPRHVTRTGFVSATQDGRKARTRILVVGWLEFVNDPNAGEWVHVDQIIP